MSKEIFDRGLAIRKKVLGTESGSTASPFSERPRTFSRSSRRNSDPRGRRVGVGKALRHFAREEIRADVTGPPFELCLPTGQAAAGGSRFRGRNPNSPTCRSSRDVD